MQQAYFDGVMSSHRVTDFSRFLQVAQLRAQLAALFVSPHVGCCRVRVNAAAACDSTVSMSRRLALTLLAAAFVSTAHSQIDDGYAPAPGPAAPGSAASLQSVIAPLGYDTFNGAPDPEVSDDVNRVGFYI